MRQQLGRFLGPLSKYVSSVRSVAQIIYQEPRHVPKLLLNSGLAPHTQSQPDVYPFAPYLSKRFRCTHVIVVGPEMAFISWIRRASIVWIIQLLSFIRWTMGSKRAWITKPTSGISTLRIYRIQTKERPGRIVGNQSRRLHRQDMMSYSMTAGYIPSSFC